MLPQRHPHINRNWICTQSPGWPPRASAALILSWSSKVDNRIGRRLELAQAIAELNPLDDLSPMVLGIKTKHIHPEHDQPNVRINP
jgi:hypothetical protein